MLHGSHLFSLLWEFFRCHLNFPEEVKVFLQDLHFMKVASPSWPLVKWVFKPLTLTKDLSQVPHCMSFEGSSGVGSLTSFPESISSNSVAWLSVTWVLKIAELSNSVPQNPHWQIFWPSCEQRLCLLKRISFSVTVSHWLHLLLSQSWLFRASLDSKLLKHLSHLSSSEECCFKTCIFKLSRRPNNPWQWLHLKFFMPRWIVSKWTL